MNLPYYCEVQERVEDEDARGETVGTWRTRAKRRCDVEAVRAGERVQATAVTGTVSHRVTLANGGDVLRPKDRVLFMGRVFEVDGVVREIRRPGKQVATCVEVA